MQQNNKKSFMTALKFGITRKRIAMGDPDSRFSSIIVTGWRKRGINPADNASNS
jgi:hypothetical protein